MNARLSPTPALKEQLALWQRWSLLAGAVLLLLSSIGAFLNPMEFFHSYLFGYLFVFGIALGSLALLMTQYLTGGAWGTVARRTFEAASRTLPWLALLFLPVAIGIPWLYPWAHASVTAASDVLRHRHAYMNVPFFLIRAVVYFAIWITLSRLLNRWSIEEDEGAARLDRMEQLSAPGLIVYVLTLSFAMVDWTESLSIDWYSTMWGFLFVAGQGSAAMGFTIGALSLLAQQPPLADKFRASHLHDLGKLLLMFVMLWAYFAFSQLLIVWSGNLTTEIPWFMPRWWTSWSRVGTMLIVLQFALPFLLLLSRRLKRSRPALGAVVVLLLFMRLVDLYWIVMPDAYRHGVHLHILQFSLPLALIGLWAAAFLSEIGKRPLLPLHAPNLQETLQHAEP